MLQLGAKLAAVSMNVICLRRNLREGAETVRPSAARRWRCVSERDDPNPDCLANYQRPFVPAVMFKPRTTTCAQ